MEFERTDDVITYEQAAELYDAEPDEDLGDTIPVCEGEWRREGSGYRFFINPDLRD